MEEELPPGWTRVESMSRPGEISYRSDLGRKVRTQPTAATSRERTRRPSTTSENPQENTLLTPAVAVVDPIETTTTPLRDSSPTAIVSSKSMKRILPTIHSYCDATKTFCSPEAGGHYPVGFHSTIYFRSLTSPLHEVMYSNRVLNPTTFRVSCGNQIWEDNTCLAVWQRVFSAMNPALENPWPDGVRMFGFGLQRVQEILSCLPMEFSKVSFSSKDHGNPLMYEFQSQLEQLEVPFLLDSATLFVHQKRCYIGFPKLDVQFCNVEDVTAFCGRLSPQRALERSQNVFAQNQKSKHTTANNTYKGFSWAQMDEDFISVGKQRNFSSRLVLPLTAKESLELTCSRSPFQIQCTSHKGVISGRSELSFQHALLQVLTTRSFPSKMRLVWDLEEGEEVAVEKTEDARVRVKSFVCHSRNAFKAPRIGDEVFMLKHQNSDSYCCEEQMLKQDAIIMVIVFQREIPSVDVFFNLTRAVREDPLIAQILCGFGFNQWCAFEATWETPVFPPDFLFSTLGLPMRYCVALKRLKAAIDEDLCAMDTLEIQARERMSQHDAPSCVLRDQHAHRIKHLSTLSCDTLYSFVKTKSLFLSTTAAAAPQEEIYGVQTRLLSGLPECLQIVNGAYCLKEEEDESEETCWVFVGGDHKLAKSCVSKIVMVHHHNLWVLRLNHERNCLLVGQQEADSISWWYPLNDQWTRCDSVLFE